MLETLFSKGINFPIGRVEFRKIYPVGFEEFLGAMNENQAVKLYNQIPLPAFVHSKLFGTHELNAHYQGKIAEHIVGQEILASNYNIINSLHFWVRYKKQSDAEVDLLYNFDGQKIPVEIKSGKSGKLRSLHQYVEMSEITVAVRFYAGQYQVEEQKTPSGKPFKLINIPYFLAGQLHKYLEHIMNQG